MPATFFARYPWGDQPLPSGTTTVTAQYRFSPPGWSGKGIDLSVTALVRIKGRAVDYPSPQALADAALADPAFHAWVESRWKNAAFYPNVDGPWRRGKSWAERGYAGGPAPEASVEFDSQAGGKTGAWVRTLAVDPWTAEIKEVDIAGHGGGAPLGSYPSPSPHVDAPGA